MKKSRCWKGIIVIALLLSPSSCFFRATASVPPNVILNDYQWDSRLLSGKLRDDAYIHPTNVFKLRAFPLKMSGLRGYESGWIASDSEKKVTFANIRRGSRYYSHEIGVMNRPEMPQNKTSKDIVADWMGRYNSIYANLDIKPCLLFIKDDRTYGLPAAYAKILLPEFPRGWVRVSTERSKLRTVERPAKCPSIDKKNNDGSLTTTRRTDHIIHLHVISLKEMDQPNFDPPAKFLVVSTLWDYELNNWRPELRPLDDGSRNHGEFLKRIELLSK